MPGLFPTRARLAKYSSTIVMLPCGWSFTSSLQRLLALRSLIGSYRGVAKGCGKYNNSEDCQDLNNHN